LCSAGIDAGIAGMMESGELKQLLGKYVKYRGAVLMPLDEYKAE
jgi:hypothetical protein